MLPRAINYVNQGVLVVFHINHNHVIAVSRVCWKGGWQQNNVLGQDTHSEECDYVRAYWNRRIFLVRQSS